MVSNIWTGNKVRLRAIVPGDWEKFHNNDYDTEGARLSYMTQFPRSEEGTRLWTESKAAEGANGDQYTFAIETLNSELIGSIGTHTTDPRNGTFKYGIGIFREHWRKGYASEAVKLLLGYYFEELRYQKASAHVYAFNEGSIALHERLGFRLEGRLRNMVYTNGEYYDELVYGLLISEFRR
ncbi:GNAT family N-acetyltransferase [Paenibacillus sp. GCM10012307]|uniref:GNAT family N-acetyltransferase n=1 Tax=Paenibacillus roseus TaxID=2798579 RepID=A0A934J336_9BACL|nr:GNAT family N-acetyltransferase [Paenibacillus roseus]MBJ6360724.1 GNAT family N-acetyltransferase [Paenibacillus roseus]